MNSRKRKMLTSARASSPHNSHPKAFVYSKDPDNEALMKQLFTLFLLLSISSPFAKAKLPPSQDVPDVMVVPFELIGSLITVQAEVGGKSGRFILDSGAPSLMLNSKHFKGGISIEAQTTHDINGAVDSVTIQTIRNFRLKQYHKKKVVVTTLDLSHIEQIRGVQLLGLIGYEIIKDFELWIDYPNSQISLFKLDRYGNRLVNLAEIHQPTYSIPFKMNGHMPVIKARINRKKIYLGLDTGAESNTIAADYNPQILETFERAQPVLLSGTSRRKTQVQAGVLHKVKVGPLQCQGMKTLLTSMYTLNQLYRTDVDGVLGYEFFKQARMGINFKKETLYIWI